MKLLDRSLLQSVTMPTYVKHDDMAFIYCGDLMDPRDIHVSSHLYPFDGKKYRYVPEEQNWTLDEDHQWGLVREERNRRIEAFRWKVDRQRDMVDLGLASQESLIPLLSYVQELRDIPQTQTDPYNIIYPEEPA